MLHNIISIPLFFGGKNNELSQEYVSPTSQARPYRTGYSYRYRSGGIMIIQYLCIVGVGTYGNKSDVSLSFQLESSSPRPDDREAAGSSSVGRGARSKNNLIVLKLCPIDISSLRLENASLTPFGERVTPAVQWYHVEPDGQADGQSLWLLHSSPLRSKLESEDP